MNLQPIVDQIKKSFDTFKAGAVLQIVNGLMPLVKPFLKDVVHAAFKILQDEAAKTKTPIDDAILAGALPKIDAMIDGLHLPGDPSAAPKA